jgi:hypothetical protein
MQAIETECEITNVVFRLSGDELVAILWAVGQPTFDVRGEATCYCHIGQHSRCHIAWYFRTKPASAERYKSLKKELEDIGYKLDVKTRRETRW